MPAVEPKIKIIIYERTAKKITTDTIKSIQIGIKKTQKRILIIFFCSL
jgi:hypothetical protein